jgi:hypothetical protein
MFHEAIRLRAARLNLKGGDLAAMANISAPALSLFFKGRKELDNGKRDELLRILSAVETLRTLFPIPIGVHDPKLLTVAIERLRQDKFSPFRNLTSGIDWSIQAEERESLERHYPKLWLKEEG